MEYWSDGVLGFLISDCRFQIEQNRIGFNYFNKFEIQNPKSAISQLQHSTIYKCLDFRES